MEELFAEHFTHSPEETYHLGQKLGNLLSPPTIVALQGDLGAGKTTFIKGLVEKSAKVDPHLVNSPTFTYFHTYSGDQLIYHFDLYRLRESSQFLALGFEEHFQENAVVCIEWSERITSLLPEKTICVFFSFVDLCTRRVSIFLKRNPHENHFL